MWQSSAHDIGIRLHSIQLIVCSVAEKQCFPLSQTTAGALTIRSPYVDSNAAATPPLAFPFIHPFPIQYAKFSEARDSEIYCRPFIRFCHNNVVCAVMSTIAPTAATTSAATGISYKLVSHNLQPPFPWIWINNSKIAMENDDKNRTIINFNR